MSCARRRLAGLTAVALAAAAVSGPLPSAFAAGGSSTLRLNGPAAKSLRAQGVTAAAVEPATGGGQKVALPVAAGLAGKTTTIVRQRGALTLRKGKASVRLADLTLVLDKRARVEAKVGGERLDLFHVSGGRRQVDPASGGIDLSGLRLKLTAEAAREIDERLSLGQLRAQRFGLFATKVAGAANGGAGNGPSGGGGGAASATCPLPGAPGSTPEEPLPVKPKPAGASDLTSAAIDWHVRDSFIRYINTGEGTSVSGGASADPPVLAPEASAALSYGFRFPFSSGWFDPGANLADPGDDSALVDFTGAVRFRYSAHGIDLATADPEIEIAGAKSRAIFSISDNGAAAQRQVLINLDLSRATAISVNGATHTYERVPGAIPPGTASSTFAGFYAPGTEFGCVTVSFTTAP
jgi:hypothetical protein